ncbi:hypothetical protein QVD17_00117 [Tagetes erecta]|uniref:Uncharacterized protein n=1 Tax=Tagetes erecta TaxID=13708 RepID=A0AAD8L7A3_TARER|nr:hypothetical protein QVD17_00117 [Tagetes erecta]
MKILCSRMENLKFEPKHNLVACLDESIPETEGYRDMIRFIRRTKYVYAMCAKPVIYARLIKSFWRTTEVVTDKAGVFVVRGNITKELQLTVTEESIRTALRIDEDEAGATDELTTAECQACFINMGHPPIFPKQQRSAGFDNFPSDIASPIVAIAENKPFNMSKWIMKGFVFNLVKGKRFKFLMYPRFLQLMINVAYPIIREEGFAGGILYTEDMNDLSYRKMSIGSVENVEMFEYMRDISNNDEDIEVVYHHISNGEIVNPSELVDEVPDNLLDDDEYFARHPEDENESENDEDEGEDDSDDSDNDGGDDGNGDDSAESVPEEAENVEVDEPMEIETENVEAIETMMTDEPVEVEKAVEEIVVEVPKDITVQYVRSRRSKPVIDPIVVEEPSEIEDVNVSELVDIFQTSKEVAAEVETVAQTVDDTDVCVSVPVPVDIVTSPKAAENIEQPLESSPKVGSSVNVNEDKDKIVELEEMVAKLLDANAQLKASNERKKKRLEEFWAIHQQNLETFKALDADHEKLKADHEKLKEDYKELSVECNTLNAENEMLEKWLEEAKPKKSSSTSDKDFSDDVMEVAEPSRDAKFDYTRARGTKNVGERIDSPIPIPDEAADPVNLDKAEGKRKLDDVPELVKEDEIAKKARMEETVQIEPIQSESVIETEVSEVAKLDEIVKEFETDKTVQIEPIQSESVVAAEVPEVVEVVENVQETVSEEAFQFEPVQTETAPMIEALDDLDDIDFTDSEPEANPDDEIPSDLPERFAYLEKMKYNPVYLNGLTVSQINEEYEKCLNAQDKVTADEKEFVVEMGEWTPLQESLNIDDLPPKELYHQDPEEMSSTSMREWLSSRNYPFKTLKRLKRESLKKIVVSFMKTEKMHNRMFFLDYNNPQYYELTKRYKVLEPKEVTVMALPEDAHKKRKELIDMFLSEMKAYNIPMDVRESCHKSATAGDIVKSLLSKGQSVAELLNAMIVPEKSKNVKIIAWNMMNPGLKVIDGSQATKPILKVFYNQETFELKLVRNLDDWDQDMITLFSTFELKLLHPSYIDFLRNYKMEKLKDPVAEEDRRLFVIMIEVIGAATKKIRLRKALLNTNLVKIDIPEIEYMRVTSKGTLEVIVKGRTKPHVFYANIDFAGINLESMKRMKDCDILTNESKPRQAKIAEKFKSCIEEALKEQEEYQGKELLDVKDEPEDCNTNFLLLFPLDIFWIVVTQEFCFILHRFCLFWIQSGYSTSCIRTALRIDEDEIGANDELTIAECQTCFVNMGHPPVFPKSQFVRARLGKKWKLLCYVIQQCMSRRSAGFDNFPSDIASPIVAIVENKPFNMSKWIMNGFIFNLVKGKRFKFLMYPRFLQLMINMAYPIIRSKGYAGGILYTEDMNDLSYRKMSIGNVPSVELFDYMRDIANNEEEIGVVYYHISNGEIVNPLDLVDKEIDEDESESGNGDDNDDGDDSGDDGNSDDSAESVHEEAENVEVDEIVGFETENDEVFEPVVTEEPVEVASVVEEMVVENPKSITIQCCSDRSGSNGRSRDYCTGS